MNELMHRPLYYILYKDNTVLQVTNTSTGCTLEHIHTGEDYEIILPEYIQEEFIRKAREEIRTTYTETVIQVVVRTHKGKVYMVLTEEPTDWLCEEDQERYL